MNAKTMVVDQPLPNEAAKRALFKVEGITVTFKGGTKKADEAAALEYLNKLIAWWNLPSREWRSGRKS